MQPTALTARALSDIVRSHLSGRAPVHLLHPRRSQHKKGGSDSATDRSAGDVHLDSGYYERGTAARKNAFSAFADVDALLDDVEERAEQLLTDLLELIEKDER